MLFHLNLQKFGAYALLFWVGRENSFTLVLQIKPNTKEAPDHNRMLVPLLVTVMRSFIHYTLTSSLTLKPSFSISLPFNCLICIILMHINLLHLPNLNWYILSQTRHGNHLQNHMMFNNLILYMSSLLTFLFYQKYHFHVGK